MSEQHTQGRLIVEPDENNKAAFIVGEDHRAIARVNNAGLRGYFLSDARRLAACWNACEGIDTDNLEKFPGWASDGFAPGVKVVQELAAARALLAEIANRIDEEESNSVGTIGLNNDADRIRAFLKGGKS